MLKAFKDHINKNIPFIENSRLLVAVSGGIDSIVLTHLCNKTGLDVALAHCNFNLRGKESDADETFVVELAEQLSMEVFVQQFDTEIYAKTHKLSTQMAARELRYNWFEELMQQLGYDYLLTAHHADDNLETFLINLSRGTGLDGLTGIPEANGAVIRPLLPFSREDIEHFARTETLSWREDSSNVSVKYLRNALRHDVIPQLKKLNPDFLSNFSKTQNHLRGSAQIVNDHIDEVSDDVMNVEPVGITLNIDKLKTLSYPRAYLYEMLKAYGFTEWNDVYHLLDAQSGKSVFSKTHRLLKDRDVLILTELKNERMDPVLVQEHDTRVEIPPGTVAFDVSDSNDKIGPNAITVDKDKLHFPLELRTWKEGDVFYPTGMEGKKKLSKYFKDEKFSLIEKEDTWLLCSGGSIVWIIGKRADRRFIATDDTGELLKISLR